MKTSTNGRKFIEQWEGCILHAYDDGTGVLTIGYGHTSAAGAPKVTAGMTITKEQADQILATDLKKVEDQVNSLVKVPLTQNQFDVLVSFQFNTGALGKSSALKYLNQKNYEQAAQNLTLYNRGGGKIMQGLVNRRNAEKKLFLTPDTGTTGKVVAGAGTVVVGGAATAASAPHNYIPWIIAGTIVLIVGWTLYTTIRDYKKSKETFNVNLPK